MSYAPLAIANTFLAEHGAERDGISHMKLQKLVFYAYGWWLAYHDAPLTEEAPQVWKFGPVFNSLYSVLAPFGMKPIDSPRRALPFEDAPTVPQDAVEVRQLLEWIWQRYGSRTAGELSDMTHAKGTPWQTEAEAHDYRVPRHHSIPVETTKAYFKSLAERLNGSAA